MLRRITPAILLLVVVFSPALARSGWFGPSNYDECLEENLKSVQSDVAARAIISMCGRKFSNPNVKALQHSASDITLDRILQYYVDNKSSGRIFVVEGVAINYLHTHTELIELELDLVDASGQKLVNKRQLAGNTLSLYNLQNQQWEQIESGLTSKSGITTNNMSVPPGREVPFMLALVNPPESVSAYIVRVVGTKEPSPLPRLVPVDYDPFAMKQEKPPSSGEKTRSGDNPPDPTKEKP